jgi:HlyD family secretion protein
VSDANLSKMDRVIEKRRFATSRVLIGAAAVAAIAAVLFVYTQSTSSSEAVDVGRLTISTVREGVYRDSIPINGKVSPSSTMYIDAVEGGKVIDVYVKEGDSVEENTELVSLENSDLQLEVIGREAQLTEQINNLLSLELLMARNALTYERELIEISYYIETLTEKYRRLEKLKKSGGVTEEEIFDTKAKLTNYKRLQDAIELAKKKDADGQEEQRNQLSSAVSSMSRNLRIAQATLDNLKIKSPISGQITTLDVKVGQSLPKGQRIAQIDEVGKHKVTAFVDEFYLGRIRVGQVATADISGASYELVVTRIYPQVRDRKFEVDLDFRSVAAEVRLGQTLRMVVNGHLN